jgi:hypothetical protein
MQERRIHAIGHEHIWANSNCNFFVALPVKAQAIGFRANDFRPINLDRW